MKILVAEAMKRDFGEVRVLLAHYGSEVVRLAQLPPTEWTLSTFYDIENAAKRIEELIRKKEPQ